MILLSQLLCSVVFFHTEWGWGSYFHVTIGEPPTISHWQIRLEPSMIVWVMIEMMAIHVALVQLPEWKPIDAYKCHKNCQRSEHLTNLLMIIVMVMSIPPRGIPEEIFPKRYFGWTIFHVEINSGQEFVHCMNVFMLLQMVHHVLDQ